MKTFLSRSIPLAAFVLVLPGCASLAAQDPAPAQPVAYSPEEMDNLVAPVALYPDALLAQILVAATFPDQIALAHQYVRERGARNIEDQGWDISVKAVAYYPPVLNMLATQEDWSVALGQAYAAQSAEVMDAVQRMREMAREQGNLVSTREQTVTEDRGRIVVVPANPQVIYVPTYDPAIVYVRPIWSFGFHTGYFSFGLGFPIGSWLAYEPDWWGNYGRRVYYHGWYGDGWRYYARRHFAILPVYERPRYSMVNFNINIFSRRVNYFNLDRRHRYVRRAVVYERHYRNDRDRYADRDRWARNTDDRRGPVGYPRGDDGPRGGGNDRIGDRIATFDDYRRDRGGTGSDARNAAPPVRSSRFDSYEKNGRTNGGAESRANPEVPVFTSPRSTERKSKDNGGAPAELRRTRPSAPVFTPPSRTGGGKSQRNGESQAQPRGSRPMAPVFTSPPRSAERAKPGGGGARPSGEFRSAPRPNATYSAPQRFSKPGGGSARPAGTFRSAPRPNATYSAPQRFGRPSGGSAQINRSSGRSAPSLSRAPSSGGGGKVKASGGGSSNRGGGGKGRKQ